ncbi:Retrovirus-related Pol polyprotein from transposon RE1 [Vitis vinifera]|uniref:Retrovirus-related Pol polyprotein from transposon RE1 n=1 Tax=Vitis vinifera TaxID=29760 RepID=A0A438GUW5_VITVI|nr:Retrovirus-related Pol polyprotein from transposon RE1 [Vitis vinifera]
MIETQYNAKVRVLRSDNGGEYQSFDLQKYLEGHGIIHQTTCSNTPQQNGVAEQKNRHLLEVVRASLIAAKTPISYWGEAITSAAYLINRIPSSSINFQTPLQALTNVIIAPTVPNLPPHGEYHKEIQTLDYDYHISKENESGQFELVNQEAGELDMSGQQFGSEDVFTEIPNQSSSVEGILNLEPDPFMKRLPHRHNRGIPKPTYEPELSTKVKYPMINYVSNHRLSESNKSFVNQLSTVAIPNSVQEALADPRKEASWVSLIYTVKYKADGSIERLKQDCCKPRLAITTVRCENVFLHGELSEEVYMDLPPGCMVSEKQCQNVCKLKKSLYGLKQSPRAWFGRFTKSMRTFGYRQSNSDHTLFLKKQHGKITALIVYVDDMVVTGNDPEERKALQNYLSREFEMKDLGPLKYFLGIEVSQSSEGIFLFQRKYALDLLQETGMSGCQPVNTPIEEAHTRPDLAYALSVVSQYMHNPGEQHMNAVMRILRYLKNAPRNGILFAKNVNHQSIEVYTDADWAGALDDRRSTSGYFTFVGGNLVTWKSKKQNVVARSSVEVEFRGMALGLCEALWLRLLLQDLGYLSRQPIRLFCDNKAACDIAHNPVQHDRIKHVEVDRFFIKEKLDDKIVELPKIRSKDQLADILTKAVSSQLILPSVQISGSHVELEDWSSGELSACDTYKKEIRATAGRRALGRLGREDFGERSSSLLRRRTERDIEESFWLVRETMPFGSQGRYFVREFSFLRRSAFPGFWGVKIFFPVKRRLWEDTESEIFSEREDIFWCGFPLLGEKRYFGERSSMVKRDYDWVEKFFCEAQKRLSGLNDFILAGRLNDGLQFPATLLASLVILAAPVI